jgi:SAM-dependent methyltransferase
MDPAEYSVMRHCEDTHWWYVGLHELVVDVLQRLNCNGSDTTVLDAGCGTGGLIEKSHSRDLEMIGLEPSGHALKQLKSRNIQNLVQADLLRTPFKTNQFQAICSQDVLCVFEHHQVESVMAEMVRIMRPGGYLVLNLPAYQWLISDHDRFVGNKSRFYRKAVLNQLQSLGVDIQYAGYRNVLLFPVVTVLRKIKMWIRFNRQIKASDVSLPPKSVNRILTEILRIENCLIRRGLSFPFGLSLFVVAKKRTGDQSEMQRN